MSDDPTHDPAHEPPADPIGLEEDTDPPGLEEDTDPPGSEQGESSGVTFGKDWRHEPLAPQREPATDPLPFDFTLTFQAIAEDLHQHPRTRDVVANLHAPISDFVIETIEDGLGFPVPSDLLSIYQQTDGLELTWSWVDDAGATRPGGALHLHSFAHVFGRWLDTLWVEDDAVDPDTLDLIWSLRGFDGHPRRDDTFQRVTAILIRDDDSPTLYTHHHGVGTHALRVGPIDYLYWCLTARGLPGWQLLASDYDLDADPQGIDPRPALFDTMSTLFPEQDLEVFERLHPTPGARGEEE